MARIAEFTVACTAIYHSKLEIPDSVKDGDELSYIRQHLDECGTEELTWINDLDPEDAVTEEDIRKVYDKDYGYRVLLDVDEDTPMAVQDDLVRAEWYRAGEGYNGDYNPENPNDNELLRFDIYVNSTEDGDSGHWEEVEDASYCTNVTVNEDREVLKKKLITIWKNYRDAITSYPVEVSVKKLGESLSWI